MNETGVVTVAFVTSDLRDVMNRSLIEGLVAFALIIGSGVLATYFALKKARDTEDKSQIIKIMAGMWVAINFFLILVIILPRPMNYLIAIVPIVFAVTFVARNLIKL